MPVKARPSREESAGTENRDGAKAQSRFLLNQLLLLLRSYLRGCLEGFAGRLVLGRLVLRLLILGSMILGLLILRLLILRLLILRLLILGSLILRRLVLRLLILGNLVLSGLVLPVHGVGVIGCGAAILHAAEGGTGQNQVNRCKHTRN